MAGMRLPSCCPAGLFREVWAVLAHSSAAGLVLLQLLLLARCLPV
jgi:hypothetical protein